MRESQALLLVGDQPGAHIGGHNDDGVFKVHRFALGVGDTAVLQNLQQDVEHIRMSLLDLIEQHHGVGLGTHSLCQLAALVKPHIPGRGTHQAGDSVLFHILGHVEADHGLFIAEHGFSQGLAQLRFTYAGGAQEDEGPDGPVFILQAHAAPADGF